ncbi:MAG: GNAT family N-acetyltransferase [Anaerolineae bacterium]|nr:GNAT family N-acetyltransferase [Anaerolineae bacterium]
MSISVALERPDTPDSVALITELEAVLEPLYPRESRHGFSIERLLAENVPFFVLRSDGTAAGCGGVKLFDRDYGEIKRMYVRPQFRGQGLARHILNHLSDYARAHGVSLLRLETGIYQHEAIALYERMGFYRIPPFGEYRQDPLSLCYEKQIGD